MFSYRIRRILLVVSVLSLLTVLRYNDIRSVAIRSTELETTPNLAEYGDVLQDAFHVDAESLDEIAQIGIPDDNLPVLGTPDRIETPHLESIINNFVEYPRLRPLAVDEFNAMRKDHVSIIEAALDNLMPMLPEWNGKMLRRVVDQWETFHEKGLYEQPKVILSSYNFVPCAITACSTTGEVIWLESVIDVFAAQNYALLWYDYPYIDKAYKQLGDVITHVWSTDEDVVWCFNDTIRCVESPENPNGIPPWKIFTFTFWGSPPGWGNFHGPDESWSYNPLGGEWNIVPYRMPDKQFYLGYRFTGCYDLPYVPTLERKDQVLILAKRSEYFHFVNLVEPSWWPAINEGTNGIDLLTTSNYEEGYPVPEELTSLGPQQRHDYDKILGQSKALLGVGRPQISPTPYASFVPVILQYKGRNCPARPNSTYWCGFGNDHQHAPSASLGEPYVYMVDVHGEAPLADLTSTIWRAVNTPIGPYEPPDMTVEALTQRLKDYFDIDWKEYAALRMQENGWERIVTQEWLYRWLDEHPRKVQQD